MIERAEWQRTQRLCKAPHHDNRWVERIEANLQFGLPQFWPMPYVHGGTIVICGSGYSLPQYLEEIRHCKEQLCTIMAIKGAHDFLYEHNVAPDIFFAMDPRDRSHQIQHASIQTAYYLSSHSHPNMLKAARSGLIVLVHPYSGEIWHPTFDDRKHVFLLPGGTTSGLRGMSLAWHMGFRKMILYGFDSCLEDGALRKRLTDRQEDLGGEMAMTHRWVNGRRFVCNISMALQADEFQETLNQMPGVEVMVKGDGLIAAIMEQRNLPKELRAA